MVKKYTINEQLSKEISVISNDNKQENGREYKTDLQGPADFETAITATGFGKYNLFLIMIALPSCWTPFFETTTMSYVFPAAQCDLQLTLQDKGLLNAITYSGMISGAVIWGFLFDTLGRRRLLMVGFCLDAIFVLMSVFSQSEVLLLISKFLGGLIVNGPFSALTAYLSEFHAAKYRARIQMVQGGIFNFGGIVLPLIAWAILPQNFYFELFDKSLEFHSWNLYLLVTSIPAITSTIIFIFMPESPKFLMTTGQNDKALTVFKRVYSVNTGKPADTYPVKELVDEIKLSENQVSKHGGHITANRSKVQAFKEGWQQMKPLFFPPHLLNLILVCLVQTMLMMSLNTLRLWFPQIFQAMHDYQVSHSNTSDYLCDMLEMIQPVNNTEGECVVDLTNNSFVYINSVIVSSVSMSSYVFAGYLINILGKKKLITSLSIFSGFCAFALYFASSTAYTTAFAALFITCGSIATNVILTVIVDLFPTTLRTMTVSLAMMTGRIGAMMGNLIFPILLHTGCGPPFFTVGSIFISCAVVALLLPKTDLRF